MKTLPLNYMLWTDDQSIQVLVLDGETVAASRTLKSGQMRQYIRKPVTMEQLLQIRDWLAHEPSQRVSRNKMFSLLKEAQSKKAKVIQR